MHDPDGLQTMRELGGINICVDCILRHENGEGDEFTAEVCEAALDLLMEILRGKDDAPFDVLPVLPRIVGVLERFVDDEELVDSTCSVVLRMVKADPQAQEDVLAAGGLASVFQRIQAHDDLESARELMKKLL